MYASEGWGHVLHMYMVVLHLFHLILLFIVYACICSRL